MMVQPQGLDAMSYKAHVVSTGQISPFVTTTPIRLTVYGFNFRGGGDGYTTSVRKARTPPTTTPKTSVAEPIRPSQPMRKPK